MSQKWMVALITTVLLVSCTAMMASTDTMGVADKQTITFSAPIMVGGTVLPAGNYTVTHQMNGQTHVMLFKSFNGKFEAKSNCNLVPLKAKAERSSQRYTTNAKDERVLQEITFEGDKASHVLVQ